MDEEKKSSLVEEDLSLANEESIDCNCIEKGFVKKTAIPIRKMSRDFFIVSVIGLVATRTLFGQFETAFHLNKSLEMASIHQYQC